MSTAVKEMHPFEAAVKAGRVPYKVKDLALAEFGRKEIRLAEHEMPGLMTLRREYADVLPLKGARISGSARRISLRPKSARARSATLNGSRPAWAAA